MPAARPDMEKQVLPWQTSSKPSQELQRVHQWSAEVVVAAQGWCRPCSSAELWVSS